MNPRFTHAAYTIIAACLISPGSAVAAVHARTVVPQREPNKISVDDLTRRVHIPLAAISPEGHFAAYLLVQGDPVGDKYQATVKVVDMQRRTTPETLTQYELTPDETFSELHWLRSSAGETRWVGEGALLFITRNDAGKACLMLWDAGLSSARPLLSGHDSIEISNSPSEGDALEIIAADFVARKESELPPDRSWRMRDGYVFFGPFRNPKNGRWLKKEMWSFNVREKRLARRDLQTIDEYETKPAESNRSPPSIEGDSESWLSDETPTKDHTRIAALEIRGSKLSNPNESYMSFRVVVKTHSTTDVLIGETRPYVRSTSIIGWSEDEKEIQFLHVEPASTSFHTVSLQGRDTLHWRMPALLTQPCPFPRRCQVVTADRRTALLVRSTNTLPAELIKIDLQTGDWTSIDSPNRKFELAPQPQVRFYEIEGLGSDTWGRLYLPFERSPGVRYPLVFVQYISSPGFAEDIGDEVPILPLLAHGIAVFDMNSFGLAQSGIKGNFQIELSRVRRPLEGMRRIASRLAAEGIIDDSKIGMAGLSYGAEIAMYAYWNWPQLKAVSVASGSWDPALYDFAGPNYSQTLDERGFPDPNAENLSIWKQLSAGMNAREGLPPLLVQSGDGEENSTVPTWTQLRRAGVAVEWCEYPQEGHIKVHPADKWWVFERNLDWFRFWLKNEEDPLARKPEQYQRWRALRKPELADVVRK